jgi:hypothetical protein
MMNNALVLHYFDGPTTPAAKLDRIGRRDVPAEWVFGSAFVAALVVALLTVAGVFAGRGAADNEWTAWAGLWFVAFLVLAGGASVAHSLGRRVLRAGSAWRARRKAAYAEWALRTAARGDPRMLRELQIIRDRAEWHVDAGR